MTVVPIPVAPTPAEPAAPDAGGADHEAAPGFANMLAGARGHDATEKPVDASEPNNGEPACGEEKSPNALTDATVLALLAALNGVSTPVAQPVATPAPVATTVVDATVVQTATAEAELAAATISLVDDAAKTTGDPVVVTPGGAGIDTAPTESGTPESAPTPTPSDAPVAPAPHAARPVETTVPNVTVPPLAVPVEGATVTPLPSASEKPAPTTDATTATAITPPSVAPTETRSTAPVASATPATPAAPPAPTEQVVAVLRPLRRAADGSYELRLQLRPPELGQVELRVELRHGVLSATMHADNPQAAEVMRNGLAELRTRLDAEGVRAGSLTVDSNAAQMSQRDRESRGGRQDGDAAAVALDTTAPTTRPATNADALLDVRI